MTKWRLGRGKEKVTRKGKGERGRKLLQDLQEEPISVSSEFEAVKINKNEKRKKI